MLPKETGTTETQVGLPKTTQLPDLELPIGTKELTGLKSAKVKLLNTKIVEVGEKKNQKVVLIVKHPDRDESVEISAVKYEKKGKLDISGLWLNKDEEGLIRKGSALANFLVFLKCEKINDLPLKECETTEDEKGYLCFKAY